MSARGPLAWTFLVLFAAALFGTLGPASRAASASGVVPLAFMTWRALVGGLIIWTAVTVRGPGLRAARAALGSLDWRGRAGLFAATIAGFTLNLAIFWAFDRITIAVALLCFYTYPAVVAAVEVATGREPLDRARGSALGLGLLGMVAVVAGGLDPSSGMKLDLPGVLAALSASLSQTIFVLVSRSTYRQVPAEIATGVILAGSALLGIAAAALLGSLGAIAAPVAAEPMREALPVLFYAGAACAAIPSVLFLGGIRRIGGTRTGILMLFEPVVGVVLAALLLSEPMAPLQVAGGVAIICAALILHRVPVREP